jgi:hypothetical protein
MKAKWPVRLRVKGEYSARPLAMENLSIRLLAAAA